MTKKYYYGTNAPVRHQQFTVQDNHDSNWLLSYDKLKSNIEKRGLSALLGIRGCGKTQAAVLSIAMVKSRKRSALYVKFLDLVEDVHFSDWGRREKVMSKYLKPAYLVIDSFQNRTNEQWENRILQRLLDKRYDLQKPTVIVSNDTVKNFVDAIGSDGVSRMKEECGIVVFDNRSFRDGE